MNCNFSVTFIKSVNQSSIKPCLIVHLVAVWTLIYFSESFVFGVFRIFVFGVFRIRLLRLLRLCDLSVWFLHSTAGKTTKFPTHLLSSINILFRDHLVVLHSFVVFHCLLAFFHFLCFVQYVRVRVRVRVCVRACVRGDLSKAALPFKPSAVITCNLNSLHFSSNVCIFLSCKLK